MSREIKNSPSTPQWRSPLGIVLALLLLGGITGGTIWAIWRFNSTATPTAVESSPVSPTVSQVTALGRLEPQGEIIQLSAPQGKQRVAQILVKVGDRVQVDQAVAVMDGLAARQADLKQAQAQVQVAQARLQQVQAGKAPGDIEAQRRQVAETEVRVSSDIKAQQTAIDRLYLELQKVQVDYERYQQLAKDGLVPQSQVDEKRLQLGLIRKQIEEARIALNRIESTGQEQIENAQARLQSLTEVRPSDLSVVQAEVREAIARQQIIEADLANFYVRSPLEGQVLKINTKAGEIAGNRGILALGQTQQMYAIAEVYESDIQYVKIGQSATVTSEYGGFQGVLQGVVEQIGLQIDRPGIVNEDPSARADVRVVQVSIRLDPKDSDRVNTLNQLQVRVVIDV
ncbi:MAG: HlyD family efflux transporter periplasmic adaptor subunit [Jaaginema sp. PMC 1079.18]|nr:HlyD family efflux transporter periplasmic adaptor subunit [Jaaginema sp. PMC 1080.18]MEC4851867.1 HlyD family efflux transporter periplasmic adaptor subunit [Jaaginema sp. PMC 1079.18]MEC4866431.1 HlyD family efflux transporter periplasmic adaptor subunit [Jaaginema sp. PMC 1078.18]